MREHRQVLAELIRQRFSGPIQGVEIGVSWGVTSALLLKELPELRLMMVDPWGPWRMARGWIRESERMETEYQHAMTMTEFAGERREIRRMSSMEAAIWVKRKSLDFVFIDGDHKYRAVLNDIDVWSEKIKSGGLLVGHDYVDPVPKRLVRQYMRSVKKAVDESVAKRGWQLERDVDAWLWWVVI